MASNSPYNLSYYLHLGSLSVYASAIAASSCVLLILVTLLLVSVCIAATLLLLVSLIDGVLDVSLIVIAV